MDISREKLRAIAPNITKNIKSNKAFAGVNLDGIVVLMNRYAPEFGITTAKRWAHFLAQVLHESAEMKYTTELGTREHFMNTYGTGELAKRLGNKSKADGYNYRGRGLIQITGRYNYSQYKEYCGFDVITYPELLAKPLGAIRSAMWYWLNHGLNDLADKDDVVAITKRINGGTNGLENRKKFLQRAKKEFRL